jgi:hypothetical protein
MKVEFTGIRKAIDAGRYDPRFNPLMTAAQRVAESRRVEDLFMEEVLAAYPTPEKTATEAAWALNGCWKEHHQEGFSRVLYAFEKWGRT